MFRTYGLNSAIGLMTDFEVRFLVAFDLGDILGLHYCSVDFPFIGEHFCRPADVFQQEIL